MADNRPDLTDTPHDLPVPDDDGGADHLVGTDVPPCPLPATDGSTVDIAARTGRTVLYAYPMTGRPDRDLPDGWSDIPGARGCTPQSCAFRDHHAELSERGVAVFGISTQTSGYQEEAVERLHLPFPLLSDHDLRFATALRMPTMRVDVAEENPVLLKRVTMIVNDATIEHVFYPVFPTHRNAADVLAWLDTPH